jgi:uncharacterized protein
VGRILFFVIIGIVIWLLWRGSLRLTARPGAAREPNPARGEDMVACARCGVHMPRSESREEGGRLVCRDNPRCRPGS